MKRTYDVITIGEAGLDTFVKLHDASLLCNVKKDTCLLCMSYADKIPVEAFHQSLGHNACNVAVGSSRLGLRAALYTMIGDDDIGRKILEKLKEEHVSTEFVRVSKRHQSSSSVVLNYKTERTILVYHAQRNFVLPPLAPAAWVYLTSLGKGFERIHVSLLRQLPKNGWKLAFNPGDQQLAGGVKRLEPILRACSLLIINKEEAAMLLGKPVRDMKQALQGLRNFGPEIVIVTDGPNGSYGTDGHRAWVAWPHPSHVVERTGAGDSFSTGVLSALIAGKKLDGALAWGSANSASVIEKVGPQQGLLTRPKLLTRLKKAKKAVKQL
ncbi:carbohydrate kinase family protein [Candidatus Uhrbacteria bacterium]|nr:carbohydrate kinase family protein [Candidatus Uhrbacteria bacterium]